MFTEASSEISESRMLRVYNAARRLNCSERTVRRMIRIGNLPAQRVDRRSWGIRASDVEQLLRKRNRHV
jgi:excisionase family DNA binding protein